MPAARSVLVVGKNAEIHKFAGWHSGLQTHMRYHTHIHREAEGGAQMSVTEAFSLVQFLWTTCGHTVFSQRLL
jgi:hypothetical protein